jgi:hypothetical protein
MKSATLTIVILFGLAFLGSGCATLSPSAESYLKPSPQDELDREQSVKTAYNRNAGGNYFGWEILYWTLYETGEFLANR